MIISYFVPEDGDSPEHPNVFSCDCPASLTLGELRKAFPLPGKYHFRALKSVGQMKVWLDLVDDSKAVPSIDESVVLKVSRISLGRIGPVSSKETVHETLDVPESQQKPIQSKTSTSQEETKPRRQDKPVERRGSEKLLSFDTFDDGDKCTPPQSSGSPFENNSNIFDFSTQSAPPAPTTTNQMKNDVNDFMNFTAPSTSSPAPIMNNGMQNKGMHNNGMGGMGAMGMHSGSSGNINAMGQMNLNGMRSQQQHQQNKTRNGLGGLDPFQGFNH